MNHRRRRDALLGWSSAALAVSVGVLAAVDLLALIDALRFRQLAGFQIAAGCKLLFDLALIGAFAFSAAAFLFEARHRARRLELGATLAAGGAAIGVIGGAIATAASIAHQFSSTYVAILVAVVAARFASVFAALGASKAFSIANGGAADTLARREGWLAWASGGLAASYALATVTQLLLIGYASDHGASNGFTAGTAIAAAGTAIAVGAGAVGALAFHASQRRQREGRTDWLADRDARLGSAMAAFVLAFFMMGLGVVFQAATAGALDFSTTAQLVLTGASSFGNAAASICAAVGFASSRRHIPATPIGAPDGTHDAEKWYA